ncbi:Abi family protein [Bacillus tianshenii]|uniref:Abi family protein n=1 Tax=Sutcliffiella tianshenii TaxID=1463404 RepID=UPI001CD2261C|nr:Abi family protein [Bacillus tianshenii]MCA1320352.1 Abi family protein [Bacillus tianshenii]
MYPEDKRLKMKQPTTIDEQMELFRSRNLQINNSEYTENILKNINYYRLTAYALTLKDPLNKDKYIEGTTFNKIIALYEFDRKLRLLLLGVLEKIEIAFRTHISYEIAHTCGPLGYKDKENFNNEKFHKEFLEEMEKLIGKSRKGEIFIEHHFKNYEGNIPIWVAIEVTSFGLISKLFRNINDDLKKLICKKYYDIPYVYIVSWMQTLANVRNICAHYGRLYNKKLTFKPRMFKEDKKNIDSQKLFAAIHIIQRLLIKSEGQQFVQDLESLVKEYSEDINYLHIGFPQDWKEILLKVNNKKA